MRKSEERAAATTTPHKGNSSTKGDSVLGNAFFSISYKAIIYSVNSKKIAGKIQFQKGTQRIDVEI